MRQRDGVATVGQKLRVRARRCVACETAWTQTATLDGMRWRASAGRASASDRFARHPLLQQQFGGLDPRVGVKPRHEHIVAEHVGQRDERHALVMREEGPHHFGTRISVGASRSPALRRPDSRSIRRSRTAHRAPVRVSRARLAAAAAGSIKPRGRLRTARPPVRRRGRASIPVQARRTPCTDSCPADP